MRSWLYVGLVNVLPAEVVEAPVAIAVDVAGAPKGVTCEDLIRAYQARRGSLWRASFADKAAEAQSDACPRATVGACSLSSASSLGALESARSVLAQNACA